MRKVTVSPGTLSGSIDIPPSKSLLHRALLCAALADGESCITGLLPSEDVKATMGVLRALRVSMDECGDSVAIRGGLRPLSYVEADARESGSTLRFSIPLLLAAADSSKITGAARLFERGLAPYFRLMDDQGIVYRQSPCADAARPFGLRRLLRSRRRRWILLRGRAQHWKFTAVTIPVL